MENSFYSIDRLVEFGMSIAIAKQMTQTMNHAMQNMHIPGSMNPLQQSIPQTYYIITDNKQSGPYSEQELSRLIADKKVTKDTFVWKPGMLDWQKAEQVPEVLKLVALTPPPFNKQ
ncbi:MAG: DUF4339 domain-containing protein [Bacteroidales bacterium]|nr:DUF4339 domain-containing protein [Bacteroidales bacterium]